MCELHGSQVIVCALNIARNSRMGGLQKYPALPFTPSSSLLWPWIPYGTGGHMRNFFTGFFTAWAHAALLLGVLWIFSSFSPF
jgi:hypothetical protein